MTQIQSIAMDGGYIAYTTESLTNPYGMLSLSLHLSRYDATQNTVHHIIVIDSNQWWIPSVAIDGNLIRNVSESQLRRHLTTAVVETTPILEKLGKIKKSGEEDTISDE